MRLHFTFPNTHIVYLYIWKFSDSVVISTHLGLFKFTRLPYGVSTGPGSFHRKIRALLLGIPGVAVYIDDIIITTPDKKMHLERLRQVLRKLNDTGLKLNFTKFRFLQNKVVYLVYRIDKNCIRPI